MAAVNVRAIKNALKVFYKENGRDPDLNEFRKLVTGQNKSDGKKVEKDTTKGE